MWFSMGKMKQALFGFALTVGVGMGLLPCSGPVRAGAAEAASAAKFRWSGECQILCPNDRCETVCKTGVVFAVDAFDAKVKAEAEFRAQASSRGNVVESTFRVVVDLFELVENKTLGEPGGVTNGGRQQRLLARAEASRCSVHLVFRFEAYHRGRLVASTTWEIDVVSVNQSLRDRGIDYDEIGPIPLTVRPF
jgi:hypothetical protein